MRALLFHLVMMACGAALALAFSPFDLWPLAWLALLPPLWFATAERPRWLLTGGIAFGVAWGAVMLDWFVTLFGPLAPQLWLLIGLMCALAFGLIGYVRRVWGVPAALILAPILWVGIEFFRSELWPLKFAWLALPYSQHNVLPYLQSASAIGVHGLSLIMVGWAAVTVWSLRRRTLLPFVAANIALAVLCLVNFVQTPRDLNKEPTGVPIAGAQLESPLPSELRNALQRLDREHPDAVIVVLPEYCLDLTNPGSENLKLVKEFARTRWVVAGAKLPAVNGGYHSGVITLAPGGELVFQQEKSVPVPLMDDGLPASERRLLETPYGKIGVAICYDMDFTFVSNDLVRQGAEFLLYPTMDHSSWGTKQRIQHASIAPLRAIENRRWVMRVASAGVSCVVDPYGRILASEQAGPPGGLIEARVAMRSDLTLYARAGWLIPWLCFAATVLLIPAVVTADLLGRFRKVPATEPVPSAAHTDDRVPA